MQNPLVITGIGVVSPYGLGLLAWCQGYNRKLEALHVTARLPSEYYRHDRAGEVPAYDPKKHLPIRGFRTMNRLTLHLLLAAELLHRQLRFESLEARRVYFADDKVSLVVGSAGPLQSILDYDLQTIDDPNYVQPGLFPNAVYSVPAGYVAIHKSIKASCITVTNGDTSALDAFNIGIKQVLSGRAELAIVGAAEELTPAYALSIRSLKHKQGEPDPMLSEGAILFSLESSASAARRQNPVYAELLGVSSAYAPDLATGFRACVDLLRHKVAPATFAAITYLYTNHTFEPAVLGLPGVPERRDLGREFGYLGSLQGALALLSVVADRRVAGGTVVLVLTASGEGNCSALLFRKGDDDALASDCDQSRQCATYGGTHFPCSLL